MLSIVIAIEATSVLKTEFFSTRPEAELSEPLSNLKIFERRVKTADI